MAAPTSSLDAFGTRLAQMLAARGLTQGQFAVALGSSPAFVSDMIRGIKKPGADFLYRVAAAFQVSLDWLLLGEGRMDRQPGLDTELFRAVALRVQLARLVAQGDAEAQHLADELLGKPAVLTTTPSVPAQRQALLGRLADTDEQAAAVIAIYNAFIPTEESAHRLRDILTAALTHFRRDDADPLATLVAGRGSGTTSDARSQPAGSSDINQLVLGAGNRVAAGDYHEN